jgi:hypothetical protein
MLTTGHWLWCLGFSYNFLKEVVLRWRTWKTKLCVSSQWVLHSVSFQSWATDTSALQHVGSQLGVSLITQKFHAELAGEGIEYSWGVTNGVYRRKQLWAKRVKESFKALVEECTRREILSTKTVRKLSRWARAYICAYYSLYGSKYKGDDETTCQHSSLCPTLNASSRHSKPTVPCIYRSQVTL